MNRMSENDKACEREDTIFLEDYVASLLRVLSYACIWPAKSFSLKILITTGMTIVFISTNSVLLFSEIASLALINDLKLFASIIGVIGMHAVGLLKWCYCIRKSNEVIDIMTKLEKCHVLCQRIDKSEEGIYKLFIIISVTYLCFHYKAFKMYIAESDILNHFKLIEKRLCY